MHLFCPLFLALTLSLSAQEAFTLGDPVGMKVVELQKVKDWTGLADYLETLTPAQRGKHLLSWMESLNRAKRWERLLEVCDANLSQMEAKTGPRLGIPRLLRAQALTQLLRHGEARLAHAENGALGYPDGYENACAEARADNDWESLAMHAKALAASKPGLGLSLQGEALCKLLKFQEAEPILEKAVTTEGHTAMAWADLACCRVERKAYPEAVSAANQALVLESHNMEAHYNLGRAHFGLMHYKDGRDALAAALATGQADPAMAENIRTNLALADRYLAYQEKKAQAQAKKSSRR